MESNLVQSRLSQDAARSLTDEVKGDAERLWRKLVELYEGEAHLVLGYTSWGAYFETEFGGLSAGRATQILNAGRVARELEGFTNGKGPTNERQARELAPLLDEPEVLREAWAEVIERHPEPTAADVRAVVQEKRDPFTGAAMSSKTDLWSTPQDLFDRLNEEFEFELDVCATAENAKCERFFAIEDDGLAQEWRGVCWMNPPYGDEIRQWVKKAHDSAKDGAIVVCLVPARVDTGWWWDYCRFAEMRFLRGRLKFGGGENSAPFPSAVVIFGHEPNVFWWERA